MPKKNRKIMTIGTDPEFFLIDKNGYRVDASMIPFFASTSPTAKVGCDCAGVPVEIRPSPAPVNNVNFMINDANSQIVRIARYCYFHGYKLVGGAMFEDRAIGAHIHFGSDDFMTKRLVPRSLDTAIPRSLDTAIPRFVLSENIRPLPDTYTSVRRHTIRNSNREREGIEFRRKRNVDKKRVELNRKKMATCLDTFFMPIANALISERQIYNRINDDHGDYGQLTSYRSQPWGMEYRTPYCFLLSPLYTKALFSLAALVGYNYKSLRPTEEQLDLNYEFYDNLTRTNNKNRNRRLYKLIKPTILKTMKYNSPNPKNNSDILCLFNLIEQKKQIKNLNVLKNYNLEKPPKPEFTVFYSEDNGSMRRLRYVIGDKIVNKSVGEVYIYPVSSYRNSGFVIYLSKNMPPFVRKPTSVHIKYKTHKEHIFIKNSIGISQKLLEELIYSNKCEYLIEYINKLKFMKKKV